MKVKKTVQQTPGLFPEIQQLLTFYHICSFFLSMPVCVCARVKAYNIYGISVDSLKVIAVFMMVYS